MNDKIYIGQTINPLRQRTREHKTEVKCGKDSCPLFHRAIHKYGIDNFKWDVVYRTNSIDNLNRMEQYMITYYDSMNNDFGYNLAGGGLNSPTSSATRLKMSAAKRGVYNGKDNPMYGKRGEDNPNYGQKRTPKQKRNIRLGIKRYRESLKN